MKDPATSKIKRFLSVNKNFFYPWLILFVGAALRLKHFFENRSVWLDEAYDALGLATFSLKQILTLQPFARDMPLQPPGYLLFQKGMVLLFGTSEFALRLLPVICSLAAFYVFYLFLKRFASSAVGPLALTLFALTEPLVYYAAEIKPYSSDVLICLGLWFLADSIRQDKDVSLLKCGLWGAVSIWFSYPALFVLFMIGSILFFQSLRDKNWKKAFNLLCVSLIWFVSFYLLYVLLFQRMISNDRVWRSVYYFVPAGGTVLEKMRWLGVALIKMFDNPLGVAPWWFFAVILIIGFIVYFKRARSLALIFVGPSGLILFGAYLNKYPFGQRFILFAAPVFFLFICEGLFFIARRSGKHRTLVFVLLSILLLWRPVQTSFYAASHSRDKEMSRPVMAYLKDHYRPQDAVYMNTSAQYAYGYYHGRFGFQDNKKIVRVILDDFFEHATFNPGQDMVYKVKVFNDQGYLLGELSGDIQRKKIEAQKDRLTKNKRTWVLLIHWGKNHKKLILDFFDKNGKRIESYQRAGAELYLYDMR